MCWVKKNSTKRTKASVSRVFIWDFFGRCLEIFPVLTPLVCEGSDTRLTFSALLKQCRQSLFCSKTELGHVQQEAIGELYPT